MLVIFLLAAAGFIIIQYYKIRQLEGGQEKMDQQFDTPRDMTSSTVKTAIEQNSQEDKC